jgi:hypothetical protein
VSPKDPCVKLLFLRVALLEGGGYFQRWGLMGGLQVIGGVPLKGIMGPWSFLPLSFIAFQP